MAHGTCEPPFPDACRTGRRFTWSGSADSVHEFDVGGWMHLASHVRGRWCAPWPGMVQDINCDGIITDRDGTERRVRWAGEQPRTPCLFNFRVRCQTDGRRAEAYGWEWGYQPEHGSIISLRDMERYGPSLGAIKRGLDRMHREDGPAEGAGRFVVRVARVLKLDGIVLLETSPTGSFRDALGTGRRIGPSDYGEAVRDIDALVLELHRACAKRLGKIAA